MKELKTEVRTAVEDLKLGDLCVVCEGPFGLATVTFRSQDRVILCRPYSFASHYSEALVQAYERMHFELPIRGHVTYEVIATDNLR